MLKLLTKNSKLKKKILISNLCYKNIFFQKNWKKYYFKFLKNYKMNMLVFIKYFLFFKKKRKIFKFSGIKIKSKDNGFLILKCFLNKEKFLINFFIFNPYIISINYNIKKLTFNNPYLYKLIFFNYLIEGLVSQYYFKPLSFLLKTKYKFR